jgi:hypothetical protein
MSPSPSITLGASSNPGEKDIPGINLAWSYSNFTSSVADLYMFYANFSDKGPIQQIPLAITATSVNISSSLLTAGKTYLFSLQAIDASGNKVSSNNYKPSAPFGVPAPTISSVVGFHNALTCNITYATLAAGDSALTGTPKINFALLDISTNEFIYFTRNSGLASYSFSNSDDARIVNNVQYEVSCFISPDASDAKHNAPSSMSNTVLAVVSDTPNAPIILNPMLDIFNNAEVLAGRGDGSWKINWTPPNDQSYWQEDAIIRANIYIKKSSASSYSAIKTVLIDHTSTRV